MKPVEMFTQPVTSVNIVVDDADADKLLVWFHAQNGYTLRAGPPTIKGQPRVDRTKFQIMGWVEGTYTQDEILQQLQAL